MAFIINLMILFVFTNLVLVIQSKDLVTAKNELAGRVQQRLIGVNVLKGHERHRRDVIMMGKEPSAPITTVVSLIY
jgi:hypothetical protein